MLCPQILNLLYLRNFIASSYVVTFYYIFFTRHEHTLWFLRVYFMYSILSSHWFATCETLRFSVTSRSSPKKLISIKIKRDLGTKITAAYFTDLRKSTIVWNDTKIIFVWWFLKPRRSSLCGTRIYDICTIKYCTLLIAFRKWFPIFSKKFLWRPD